MEKKTPIPASRLRQAGRIQPAAPLRQNEDQFYNLPNSPASNLLMETLGAGIAVAELGQRHQQISHNATYTAKKNKNRRKITYISSKAEITIELGDINLFSGSNKAAKKLFILALIKANEQAVYEGKLTKGYVTFPLQELIDIGAYKDTRSARRGFKSAIGTLTSLKVSGRIQKNKKQGNDIDALAVVFTTGAIVNNQCTIMLNPVIDWGFLLQYFTLLPRYYFKLSNRAGDLLYYIFYLARQKTREIEKRGYFTIGFRAIQTKLMLPSENATKNPTRDIKDEIDKAIEEIETEHSSYYDNMDFQLLPVCNEDAPIADYLDNGYLKVTLKGNFAQTFIQISKDTAKKIDNAEKRKQRIADKAIAIKTAKALEDKADPDKNDTPERGKTT